jgi:hypothetical protein
MPLTGYEQVPARARWRNQSRGAEESEIRLLVAQLTVRTLQQGTSVRGHLLLGPFVLSTTEATVFQESRVSEIVWIWKEDGPAEEWWGRRGHYGQ